MSVTRPSRLQRMLAAAAVAIAPTAVGAQESARPELHPGSAVVRRLDGDGEALIRILCNEAGLPEAGFTTEANRVTRAETGGRYNQASLRIRPWQDTGDVLVTTDWGIAWIPKPTSVEGVLAMEVGVGPTTIVRDGAPVLVTYDMWKAGDLPDERVTVAFEADCTTRDPAAPAWRRVGGGSR